MEAKNDTFFEDDAILFWCENEITYVIYKLERFEDVKQAVYLVNSRLNLIPEHPIKPMLIDANSVKYISKSVRDYMNKEGTRGVSCCAIISDNKINNLCMNFMLMFFNLYRTPCKIFSSKVEANKWLKITHIKKIKKNEKFI